MQVLKNRNSFLYGFSLAFFGILLLLPLIFFRQVLEKLVNIEERQLKAMVQEKLLLETESFQNDINPRTFVENSLRKLNSEFGLSFPQRSHRVFRYPSGYDPALVDSNFIPAARNYLRKNYGIDPNIVIAADCDLQNSYSFFKPNALRHSNDDAVKKNELVKRAVFSVASNDTYVKNILPFTESLEKRKKEFIKIRGTDNTHILFSFNFRSLVSYFANPPLYTDDCIKYFNKTSGNQRCYAYGFKAVKYFPENKEGIYGLYFMVIPGSSFEPQIVLKKALNQSSNDCQRKIVKLNIQQPHFHETDEGIYYLANFTSGFFQIIQDCGLKDPEKEKFFRKYFRTHALASFASKKELVSPNRKFLPVIDFLIKLLILFVFATFVYTFIHNRFTNFNLNWKLKTTIALIVFIPILGILFAVRLVNTANKRYQIIKIRNHMHRKISKFELLDFENDIRTVTRFLHKKSIDARFFNQPKVNREKLTKAHEAFKNKDLGVSGLFFHKNGKGISFNNELEITGNERKNENFALLRILSDLGIADFSSPRIRRLDKEQYFLGSYADPLFEVLATPENLAAESSIIKDVYAISTLKKCLLQLIASPADPENPYGIVYNEVNGAKFGNWYLDLLNKNPRIKSVETISNGIIEYAAFLRTNDSLRKEKWPARGSVQHLRKIAKNAVKQRNSGSITSPNDNSMILTSWSFKETSPIVIVARAVLTGKTGKSLIVDIIPWLLLLYGLLAIVIISNWLSNYFLNPVALLLKGVNKISNGQYGFNLSLKSGDEFSHLADSFNKMTGGLLQREKMKRFVSDKLFESIQDSPEKIESRVVDITVLSSDIRDFTIITEQYNAEQVVAMLNDYLTLMERSIKASGGAIEKIIGDAIIASFSVADSEQRALISCKAALEMRKKLTEFNQRRLENNLFTIENGIGISDGKVIFGFAGQKSGRQEFIISGDPLKRAENLESLSKEGKHSKIIIDETIHRKVNHKFNLIPIETGDKFKAWEITTDA
ncbi:MAG: adenylate/guanylate cyclase domain-containing protein [Candidatus Rifleibacteriota bacterium]